MTGRAENKLRSQEKMNSKLESEPQWLKSFYNELFLSEQYLTAQNYTLSVIRFLNYLLDKNKITTKEDLSGFTSDNIVEYLLQLKGRGGGECSDSVRMTNWAALKKFSNFLIKRKLINSDPLDGVERPKMRDNPKQVYMTIDELNVLNDKIKNNTIGNDIEKARRKNWVERNLAIITLLRVTGMRVTALTELNVSDYDSANKKITVVDKRETLIDYSLNDYVIDILDKWLNKRKIILGDEKTEALFISNRKKRITSKGIRDIISAYTSDMDKHITPHKFRSSFISNIYLDTKDILYTQRLAHHKRIDTTQIYTKAVETDNMKSVNIMTKGLK